jgi:HAD superfamily hydrolase (TIGR01509 family)
MTMMESRPRASTPLIAALRGCGQNRRRLIHAVVFDVGETLVDETRAWGEWADWLGVSRLTFFAALGSVVERGLHHRLVFQELRPGIDLDRERANRLRAGAPPDRIGHADLYPDARPCLEALRASGRWLALAGNQPESAELDLRALDLPVDFVLSSARVGVEKPDPEFFALLVAAARRPAQEIAYVGDRLDNDVLPAIAAGMRGIFLRRGPWGMVHARRADAACADARIESLSQLPAVLEALDAAAGA